MKQFYAKEIRKQIAKILSAKDGRSIKYALIVALGDIAAAIEETDKPKKKYEITMAVLYTTLGVVVGGLAVYIVCLLI